VRRRIEASRRSLPIRKPALVPCNRKDTTIRRDGANALCIFGISDIYRSVDRYRDAERIREPRVCGVSVTYAECAVARDDEADRTPVRIGQIRAPICKSPPERDSDRQRGEQNSGAQFQGSLGTQSRDRIRAHLPEWI
jgi:hypothetical protein